MRIVQTIFLLIFVILTFKTKTDLNQYTIKLFKGSEVDSSLIHFFAQQIITTFYEYPYLYVGNLNNDVDYLNWFFNLKSATVAIAYKENKPIGFLTGVSLEEFDQHFKGAIKLFEKNLLSSTSYYYFAEIIILPEHRGNFLAEALFKVLEKQAYELGFSNGCFITDNTINHPLRPKSYKPFDSLWTRIGYKKSSLIIEKSWQTRQIDGTVKDEVHQLIYWLKKLSY